MPTQVAVIVSNHNCKKCLRDCFDSLLRQTYRNFEIYFLDIASSDGSAEYVSKLFPAVRIIALKANCGFARGYNLAVSAVKAEYIAFLNSDTKTEPLWLEKLVESLEQNPDAAIVGSKIYLLNPSGVINSCGKKLTYSGTGFDIGYGLKGGADYDEPKETGGLCGASLLARKTVFQELGGFDEDYFLLCEDTDLCWRAWLAGYRVLYQPLSLVGHEFGSAIGKRDTPMRIFYTQRNALTTVFKNFGVKRLAFALAVITAYTAIRILFYLAAGQGKNLKALLAGTGAFFPQLGPVLAKRRVIQANRKVTDVLLSQKGLLASLRESLQEYFRVSRLKS
ncbi:MAG: glycosyltransferase family 2 protein [Candidatus Omnitrophota bacterium]